MTTPFYSNKCLVGGGIQPRAGLDLIAVAASYTVAAIPLTADIFHMVKVPAGATLVDLLLDTTALDAGSNITLSVGYTGALEAFISQSTVAQAGGVARLSVAGGSQKFFAAEDTIQVSVTLQGATTAAGTIKLTVYYTMDP